MRITFGSYLQASRLLQSEPNVWDVIVVLDSGLSLSPQLTDYVHRHLVLRFDDITTPDPGKRLVEKGDISRAIEFARETENCMVTCRAGQSRSAAVAFALAYQLLGAESAGQLLNPKRHVPNLKVAEVASASLGNAAILSALQDWKHAYREYRLADYYDEIEVEYEEMERAGIENCITEQ